MKGVNTPLHWQSAIMTQFTVLKPKNISGNKLSLSKWKSSCYAPHSCSLLHFSRLQSLSPQIPCSDSLLLTSISILSLYLTLSISKGQMLPAVTVALHWYSALNLAKSKAAVSTCCNQTAIWHRPQKQKARKVLKNWRNREIWEGDWKEETDRLIRLSSSDIICCAIGSLKSKSSSALIKGFCSAFCREQKQHSRAF